METEKAMESSLQKDGTQAKVDIAEGSVPMTTTDAAGKTSEYQMGEGNTMLALNDEKSQSAVQVVIDKADAETQTQIVAQRRTPK